MADPGFPVGGHGLPRRLHFENFVCQNERIWILRGALSMCQCRSANDIIQYMHILNAYSFVSLKFAFPYILYCSVLHELQQQHAKQAAGNLHKSEMAAKGDDDTQDAKDDSATTKQKDERYYFFNTLLTLFSSLFLK